MYIRIMGNSFTDNVFREIQAITDKGRLFIHEMNHDKKTNLISLRFSRYGIKSTKRNLFGKLACDYDTRVQHDSVITVRNVISCEMENNFPDPSVSEIIMLFGLTVKNKELYIHSVEESKGKTMFSLRIKVIEIDIEITDDNTAITAMG